MLEKTDLFLISVAARLESLGFKPLRRENEGGPVSFARDEGGVFYFAALHDGVDAAGSRARFMDGVHRFADGTGARNVVVYNVFAAEEYTPELRELIDGSEEYASQRVYEINYAAAGDALYYNEKQPYSMFGFDKAILAALRGEETHEEDGEPERPPGRAFLVYVLLAVNALIFAVIELSGGSEDIRTLIGFGALTYEHAVVMREYYRLFTSMLLHIGFSHLAFNSLSLYIFGSRIEKYFGHARFVLIYFASGLAGSAATLLFIKNSVAAGASGAIYGLMGAALAKTQTSKKPVGGLNIYSMLLFAATGVIHGFATPNVGNAAHVGGLICGYVLGLVLSGR